MSRRGRVFLAVVVGAVLGSGGCSADVRRGDAPSPPTQTVTVVGSFASGYYGIHVDLLYRASTSEHVLDATLHASGITGRTEMYKNGTDTSGMPQHPTLAAGETASVAAFTIPACGTPDLGAHPALSVVSAAPDGGAVTTTLPLDSLSSRLTSLARSWCAGGVMISVTASQGYQGCDSRTATLVVRNPGAQSATLTTDGGVYTAPALTVPAGGAATWTVHSPGGCPAHPSTATVRYGDGSVTHVSLGFDSSL